MAGHGKRENATRIENLRKTQEGGIGDGRESIRVAFERIKRPTKKIGLHRAKDKNPRGRIRKAVDEATWEREGSSPFPVRIGIEFIVKVVACF